MKVKYMIVLLSAVGAIKLKGDDLSDLTPQEIAQISTGLEGGESG